MATKAQGRILFWEGASMWILSAPPGQRYPRTDHHAHHVVQVTIALSGRIDFDCDGKHVGGVAVAISPDARHAFEGTGLVAHLFVAPEGAVGRALVSSLFATESIATIPERRLGDLPARLKAAFEDPRATDERLTVLAQDIIEALAGARDRARAYDPRIDKVITWMTGRLDQAIGLREVAEVIRLSPGRMRHLFVQQTGLPFRTYLLWLRLVRAVEIFAVGESLTEAAYGAGFADQAHLSRTFRRMFGIAAASLRVSPPARRRKW
jgi:AraC family transcriptional regulator